MSNDADARLQACVSNANVQKLIAQLQGGLTPEVRAQRISAADALAVACTATPPKPTGGRTP